MKITPVIITTLFLLITPSLQAQLSHLINNADIVLEGEIMKSTPKWNKEKTLIITENLISVKSLFKGAVSDSVIIINTAGGLLDDNLHFQTHSLQLNENEKGYFFLNQQDEKSYTLSTRESSFFKEINNNLRSSIYLYGEEMSKKKFENAIIENTKFPKLSFEDNILYMDDDGSRSPDTCNIIRGVRGPKSIEFYFDNIEIINNYQQIEFDIKAKVNTPGLKFGSGRLLVNYSKEFGSNIVANSHVNISKGDIIQQPLYNLTYQDISEQTLEINIQPQFASNEMYTFGAEAESLVHAVMDYDVIGNLGNISFDDLVVAGEIYYYCDGELNEFEEVMFGDSIIAVQSISGVTPKGITYIMKNGEASGNQYCIDIYAKGTESSLFSHGAFYIDYNTEAFGDNIVESNAFGILRGDLVAIEEVYPELTFDYPSNGVLEVVYGDYIDDFPTSYSTLTTNEQYVCTICFNILDCDAEKGLKFNDFIQEDPASTGGPFYNTWYNPSPAPNGFIHVSYTPIETEGEDLGKVCGCEKPEITSFSPTTIHAGNEEILTIEGDNFGTYDAFWSQVKFKDGDASGEVYMITPKSNFKWDDVIHWDDNKIEVMVPSTDKNENFKRPASSGKFIVKNQCGEDKTKDELNIPYAFINWNENNVERAKKIIVRDTDSEGVVFQFSKSIPTSGFGQIVRNAFRAALDEWCIATNINFSIGDDTNNSSVGIDDANIIAYHDLASGVASLSILGYQLECESKSAFYLRELDFGVKETSNASFIQLKSRLLHELGHAHMLNHSNNTSAGTNFNFQNLMYHQAPPANHESIIQGNDKAGALLVFDNSTLCADGIGTGLCSTSTIENNGLWSSVSIVPNPVGQSIRIINESNHTMDRIKIYDQLGNLIIEQDKNIENVNLSNIKSGTYFVTLLMNHEILNYKIIKL